MLPLLPSEEDIKLNSQTLTWPSRMEPIFEVSQKKLATRRETAENQLKERRAKFEDTISTFQAEVESYQEKELPRNVEEVKKTAAMLDDLSERLAKASEEATVSWCLCRGWSRERGGASGCVRVGVGEKC